MNTSGKRRYRQIACATRGGEASRPTEDHAIMLARMHGATLIFLYIVDVSFARGLTGKFDIEVVAHDLQEIGKIVLEQAKERARELGVNARGEMREGRVAEEIHRFMEKHKDLDLLVIGQMGDELREAMQPVLQEMTQRGVDIVVVPDI